MSTHERNIQNSLIVINACYTLTEQYRTMLAEMGKKYALSENEMLVLIHLGLYPEACTQKKLQTTKLNLSVSSICRMVDALRRKGLLTTQLDENDRRSWIIRLQESGRGIVDEFNNSLQMQLSDIFEAIPAFNTEKFVETMACLRDAANQNTLAPSLQTVC